MPEVLSDEQIEQELTSLNVGWSALPGQGLVRVFDTGNFAKGMELANKIASISETLRHHPELHLTYDELEVTLFTHSAGGVTQHDFALAKAIDQQI